LERRELLNW